MAAQAAAPAAEAQASTAAARANGRGARATPESGSADAAPLPPPETPLAPSFDAPLPLTAEQRLLEEVSTWSRLWKPFLYESIGWFVGGFLILAGTLFFVAESWEGMTTTLRSLVVFGLTAGYSAGFSAWGRYFLKRERVVGAGRVLGLIGSAAAPLPALALFPLAGTAPIPFWVALVLWSLAAAWLTGAPTDAHASALKPILRLAMGLTTAVMGLAPYLVPLGGLAIWLDAIAVIWLAVALDARGSERSAFALLAPTYLGLLFAIRVHVALGSAGVAVPLAAYAPLVAALGLVVVRARRAPSERALDPVALGAVAFQVAAVAGSVAAPAPAFFLSSALCTATLWHLGRGEGVRARWHYATYAIGYLAYQSVGTVVPGPVMELFRKVKAALGYADQPFVPPNFAAVYAVPYVVGIAAFAARLVRSQHVDPVERERQHMVGGVLLNATAVGAALFSAEAMFGTDLRPGLWAVPPLAITCLSLGLWLERRLLSWVGSLALLAVPVSAGAVYSVPVGVLSAGGLAAALAILSWRIPRSPPHGRTAASAALAVGAGFVALIPPYSVLSALGVALGSAAMALVAVRRKDLWAWAACGALALVAPTVATLAIAGEYTPLVLASAALMLSAWSRRKVLEAWGPVAVLGAVAAVILALAMEQRGLAGPVPVLAVGWVTCLLASRATLGWSPVIGAPMLGLAIAPRLLDIPALWHMPVERSLALFAVVALGASAWTVWRGRSAAAFAHGLVAIAGASVLGIDKSIYVSGVYWGLASAAAISLLGARAVLPRLSVAWAAGLAVAAATGQRGELEVWVAIAFTALAALEEWPRARALLFGPRPIATVASAGAVAALLVWRSDLRPDDAPGLLAALCVLALVWARASGRSIFLAVPALMAAPWTRPPELAQWALLLLPLWSVAVVRTASWSPRALHRLIPGGSPDRVSLWTLGALFASAGLHVLVDVPDARPLAFAAAGALLLAGGPFQALRIACAAALALPYPEARVAGVAALIGLGFLSLHAPRIASWLIGPVERSTSEAPASGGALGAAARSVFQARAPLACALASVALAAVHWLSAASQADTLLAPGLLLLGGTLWAAALLTGRTWVLGVAAFVTGVGLTELGLKPMAAISFGALGAAALAALLRGERAQERAHALAARLGAGLPGGWSQPLWMAGATSAALAVLAAMVGQGDWLGAVPLLIAAALLIRTPEAAEAAVGSGLFGAASFAVAPEEWRAVSGAAAGLALCLAARLRADRLPHPLVLGRAGWLIALASLFGLHGLGHASTPIACALAVLSVWVTVWGDERLEPLGWAASLAFLHVGLMHAGVVFSTGKPKAYILPYVGASSALLAAVALWLGPKSNRQVVGLVAAAIALAEIGGGLALIDAQAIREALVAGIALATLAIVAVVVARRDEDETAAHLAQLALAFGYLVVRRHGMGGAFGQGDTLVALLAGAAFGGLYGWASRQPSQVFRRPAMLGAIFLPVAGLLAAPWDEEPLVCAALLVGLAAHFAALARREELRGKLSLLSAVAFNAALLVAWQGTGAGEPQYYVIPAAISVLVLLRVFRDQLEEVTRARLRALALTALYGAAAWKPLVFDETWAMLVCALVCVLGVAVGVATRIRSYVYLGTAFLVVTVSANLVRYGLRDHRLGAVFLSVLGLMVVGFMVLLSAQRAELLKRYERVRQLLSGWE